jgi:hypothetical protein
MAPVGGAGVDELLEMSRDETFGESAENESRRADRLAAILLVTAGLISGAVLFVGTWLTHR